MSSRISDFGELPEWFRNTDYLAAEAFSEFDWYFHVASRHFVWAWQSMLDDIGENLQDPARGHSDFLNRSAALIDEARKLLNIQNEIIRKDPVQKVPKRTLMRDLGPAFSTLLDPLNMAGYPPIKRATLLDIYQSLKYIPKPSRKAFAKFVSDNSLPESDNEMRLAQCDKWPESPVVDLHSEPGTPRQLDYPSFGLFRANLWMPDDVLIESFRQMLHDTRSEEQRGFAGLDSTTKSRRRKWIDHGVLPYLDLKSWSREENRQISSGFLALAFAEFSAIRDPQCKYSSSTIDTTVKKYAYQMMSSQTLHRLQAEAQSEIEARTSE